MVLMIASSVAWTVPSKTGFSESFGSIVTVTGARAAAAFGFAVENVMKMSPDPLPDVDPVRASPMIAHCGSRCT